MTEELKKTFIFPGTYVYGEPLCILQIAEYFVGRKSDAFIHGVTTTWATVNSTTFRHGRQRFDAAYVRAYVPPPSNQHARTVCGVIYTLYAENIVFHKVLRFSVYLLN